ncbi:PREDICTED: monocarboxylate transporter 5-like, partial [Priapulus caudatus]|uniref:Monocarboxylate transporter 5-like n=1 Tax=Priapulus caudatus TaxID=37621 RepID=A0ABM1EM31_PRICU
MAEIEEGSDHQHRPDGGWGWMVVLGCSVIMALTWGQQRSFGIYMISITETLGVDVSATAPIQGLNTAICLMMAIGIGMLTITAFGATNEYFSKRVALATGIVSAGAGLGFLVLPLLGKWLIDAYGYQGAMLINGAIVLNTLPCMVLYRPLHPHKPHKGSEKAIDPAISVTASTNELLKYGELESSYVTGRDSVAQDGRSLNIQQGNSAADCSEVGRPDEDRSSVTTTQDPGLEGNSPKATPVTHKKKGFAWEIFKDARLWVLCAAAALADAAVLTAPIYLPLLSLEVGGDDINEAIGVSLSSIMGTVTLILLSGVWDVGVFSRPLARQIGYVTLGIAASVATIVTGLLHNYAALMAWVIVVVPTLGGASLSPFYMVVRDIATPASYADALSTVYLTAAPFTLLGSLAFGKHSVSKSSDNRINRARQSAGLQQQWQRQHHTYVALGLCSVCSGALALVIPLLTIFYYPPKVNDVTEELDYNPADNIIAI